MSGPERALLHREQPGTLAPNPSTRPAICWRTRLKADNAGFFVPWNGVGTAGRNRHRQTSQQQPPTAAAAVSLRPEGAWQPDTKALHANGSINPTHARLACMARSEAERHTETNAQGIRFGTKVALCFVLCNLSREMGKLRQSPVGSRYRCKIQPRRSIPALLVPVATQHQIRGRIPVQVR